MDMIVHEPDGADHDSNPFRGFADATIYQGLNITTQKGLPFLRGPDEMIKRLPIPHREPPLLRG
jgi:hypothetical protein